MPFSIYVLPDATTGTTAYVCGPTALAPAAAPPHACLTPPDPALCL